MTSEGVSELYSDKTSENDTCHHLSSLICDGNVQPDHSTDKGDNLCVNKDTEISPGNDETDEPENHTINGHGLSKNSSDVVEIGEFVDKTAAAEPSTGAENGFSPAFEANKNDQRNNESPITGVKRARAEAIGHQFGDQPSVHVIYNSLTRDSKKKLKELLEQWSQWHAQHESSLTDLSTRLEYGEETYFPALNVGGESLFSVTFWVDGQSTKAESKEDASVNSENAPLYDRGYVLGTADDGGSNNERNEGLLASRCFNCGSYSHSLKECSRPRDIAAINNARKQHSARKSANTSAKGPSRYYQSSSGKFDDLKPGVLSSETRACLGIGESDPPPWLQRMRELGYPPGYLDVKEDDDKPSGITIFGVEDMKPEYEDGELPNSGEPLLERTMTVEFPGINAPIPDNADAKRWATRPASGSEHGRNRYENSSSHLSDPHRSFPQDQIRHREYVSQHDLDNRPSSSHGYSQRYSPYSQSPTARSPILGRSSSDRWASSPLAREGPGYGSPSPLYSGSHSLSSQYSPSFDRWDPNSPSGANHGGSSLGRERERYDPHRHHHHHRR